MPAESLENLHGEVDQKAQKNGPNRNREGDVQPRPANLATAPRAVERVLRGVKNRDQHEHGEVQAAGEQDADRVFERPHLPLAPEDVATAPRAVSLTLDNALREHDLTP